MELLKLDMYKFLTGFCFAKENEVQSKYWRNENVYKSLWYNHILLHARELYITTLLIL